MKRLITFLYTRFVAEPWIPEGYKTMWLSIPERTFSYMKDGNGRSMSHILSNDWKLTLRFKGEKGWKDLHVV